MFGSVEECSDNKVVYIVNVYDYCGIFDFNIETIHEAACPPLIA